MSDIRFFFITICYNNLQGLQRTVNSLLQQDHTNWNCIIVDGNSSDGTKPYLQQLEAAWPNIRTLSEPDKGIYDAMNKGLERMPRCTYFCFLNSGDSLYASNTLADLAHYLDALPNPRPAIVYGHMCEEGGTLDTDVIKPAKQAIRLEKGMFCSHQSMFFHYRYSKLRYDLSYKLSADYDYVVRAIRMLEQPEDMIHVDHVISRFDMSGVSNSRRLAGILEEHQLRVRNEVCSPLLSAGYGVRAVALMWLKRFSYPLYLGLRKKLDNTRINLSDKAHMITFLLTGLSL